MRINKGNIKNIKNTMMNLHLNRRIKRKERKNSNKIKTLSMYSRQIYHRSKSIHI